MPPASPTTEGPKRVRALVTAGLEVLGILSIAAAAALAVDQVSTPGALATGGVVLFAGTFVIERASTPAPDPREVDAL